MYRLLRPLLFLLPAETAHGAALLAARLAQATVLPLLRRSLVLRHPALSQRCFGLLFDNPVGLAAGVDKDARLVPFWEALGFGLVEVGSVSARPSAGNPRPRAFRLPADRALINRMGLPSEGADAVAERLRGLPRRAPLGVNLVKTHDAAIVGEAAIADFRESFRRLAPLADYVTLNVSCPNTADGATFEEPAALDALLSALAAPRRAREVPLLLKLAPPAQGAPDEGRLREQLAVARARGVAGLVLTNTTTARDGLRSDSGAVARIGRGGLSGPPLAARAEAMVRAAYRLSDGKLPIIGVGGVDSAEAAYRRVRAGARLVQLYTGLVYEGPGLVRRINEGLLRLLERDHMATIEAAVGVDAD